jgi:hypothetical protein
VKAVKLGGVFKPFPQKIIVPTVTTVALADLKPF